MFNSINDIQTFFEPQISFPKEGMYRGYPYKITPSGNTLDISGIWIDISQTTTHKEAIKYAFRQFDWLIEDGRLEIVKKLHGVQRAKMAVASDNVRVEFISFTMYLFAKRFEIRSAREIKDWTEFRRIINTISKSIQ